MISLPGPDKNYTLALTLPLVADLEAAHGSLYALAARLLDNTLPLTDIALLLKNLYARAGADITDEFLLRQPCAELLTGILLDILGPVERMGALTPGEELRKTSI